MANKKTYTASETLEPVPEFSKTVMNHIYYVADTMIGKANYVEDDRCDLIQELSLAAWQAMTTYRQNENAAIDTYAASVVDGDELDVHAVAFEEVRHLLQIRLDLRDEPEEGHHKGEPSIADDLACEGPLLAELRHVMSGQSAASPPPRVP